MSNKEDYFPPNASINKSYYSEIGKNEVVLSEGYGSMVVYDEEYGETRIIYPDGTSCAIDD